ncbi:MAG: BatA and WFA domain-containing protein [Proteobacteria bacterium]|nr:BatA and WFA domain-containing protein [Pseudomonadota bacterium]
MSFLAPFGLLLGGLSVPLIALYFLKLRRRKVTLPSLLLWHQFQKSQQLATPFQRFRRNLLLLLQLLLLLLLTLALAQPFFESDARPGQSVVIVIDSSASMLATDAEPTRIDAAKAHARTIVDKLSNTDEAMVVVAGPRTEVRQGFTRDRGEAKSAIDAIEAIPAQGSLREGLMLALSMARSRPGVELVVLSDGSGEDLTTVPTGGVNVRYVQVGRSADNSGILALDLRRSPVSELDRQLFVTVQNFGRQEQEGAVGVYLDNKLVGMRNEKLPPDEPVSLVFELSGAASGELRVELEADSDYLKADDVAFAVISETTQRKVLLVGGDALTARVLAADPRVKLSLAKASEVDAEACADFDATVFMGPVPSGMEGQHYAVLGPHPGSPVRFGEEVRAPAVLGWRRTHPLARFVEWESVLLSRAQKVTDPGSLAPIVESDYGPIVLAGEQKGGRVVQLGFDPRHSDILLRVAWPVTVLNAVGWLTEGIPGAEGARGMATGSPFTRRVAEGTTDADVSVKGPEGAVAVSVNDGLLRVRDTTAVGIYEVQSGAVRTKFAANLVSNRESRIAPRGGLGLADGNAAALSGADKIGRREIWRELLMLALLFLMAEWWAWNRRKVA